MSEKASDLIGDLLDKSRKFATDEDQVDYIETVYLMATASDATPYAIEKTLAAARYLDEEWKRCGEDHYHFFIDFYAATSKTKAPYSLNSLFEKAQLHTLRSGWTEDLISTVVAHPKISDIVKTLDLLDS